MTILIFILSFILGFILYNPKKQTKTATCTSGHKWYYENENTDEEYMICKVCNRRPGAALDDGSQL